jgi:hypothetical protein
VLDGSRNPVAPMKAFSMLAGQVSPVTVEQA